MTNKKKEKAPVVWSHKSIVKEIKKFIRFGQNLESIKYLMQTQIHPEIMDHSTLERLVCSTVEEYPSYDLIQKIVTQSQQSTKTILLFGRDFKISEGLESTFEDVNRWKRSQTYQ